MFLPMPPTSAARQVLSAGHCILKQPMTPGLKELFTAALSLPGQTTVPAAHLRVPAAAININIRALAGSHASKLYNRDS